MLEMALRFAEALAAFDPSVLSGDDCLRLATELARVEKACGAARARAAARAAACGAHRDRGFADAADWLAEVAGTTVGEARSTLATAEALESCAATREAAVAGDVSMAQAGEIVRTESELSGSEAELLELARRSALGPLRDEARRRRLTAVPAEALHDRQHRAREFRHWRDAAGMVRIAGALPPIVGVGLMNRLDAETDRVRRAARTRDEPRAAHAADAFVKLLCGSGPRRPARADVVVVCDLRAWRRGHAHPGEPVQIVGGGPVPVWAAKAIADDAFLKAVLHDGVRIDTVTHLGRHIPAELRTALSLGALPEFGGVTCVECDRRYGLEWDHVNPVANGGKTSFATLQPRCWPHHQAKTDRDRRSGLLGPAVPP